MEIFLCVLAIFVGIQIIGIEGIVLVLLVAGCVGLVA